MRISKRSAYTEVLTSPPPKENVENIGTSNINIESGYEGYFQEPIKYFRSSNFAKLLIPITNIFGSLRDSDKAGKFSSSTPDSIWINVKGIESSVRSAMQGQPEEKIKQAINKEIIDTMTHEITHQGGEMGEAKPDEEGKRAGESYMSYINPQTQSQTQPQPQVQAPQSGLQQLQSLQPISCRDIKIRKS
jgi:hypothetical protein